MKIGIHSLWMDSDPHGGVATYLKTLLVNLGQIDKENDYRIYYTGPGSLSDREYLPARFHTQLLWPSSLWIEIPISLPLELLRRPVDLLHVLVVAPPVCPIPFVQTLNDVTFETHPEVYPKSIRWRLSRLVRMSARRARRILTVSDYSKKCIMEAYGVPEERIVVTYHGVNPRYRPVEDPEARERVRTRYSIPEKFILYVGKLQARKNIARLLRAFHILKRERQLPHKLVLVGKQTWMSSDMTTTVEELDLHDEVVLIGEVPLEDLVLFYNAAELFVFPSLCEGFGIPPLEAMACGTPVVASNATSLPEVVGDAGILVDPYDFTAMSQAMYDVLTSEDLRKELASRGLKRVSAFSSERMAEQVLEVYREAVRTSINGGNTP